MALAPVAYELWQNHLRYDPADPVWPNRDRFVLSAGHASMLLYSMLHLAGVRRVDADYEVLDEPAVSLHEIEEFRQLHSRTPGPPRVPLDLRRRDDHRAARPGDRHLGRDGARLEVAGRALQHARGDLFDFDVYAIAGDGCLMEGVSHESASLAGHLKLDNLCWIYDNNHITIDGDTALAYDDDVLSRFEGYGWNVLRVGDANDASLLSRAFEEFKAEVGRPTLIVVDSHIGWGSPNKQDTESAHGEPLGEEEVKLTKRAYGWPEDAQFLVPDGVEEHFAEGIGKRGAELRAAWEQTLSAYKETNAALAAEIEQMQHRELPDGWDAAIPSFEADEEKGLATRKASNKVQNAIAERVPWMISGSADLTDSTSVRLTFDGAVNFEPGSFDGRQIHFGIREHAAAATCNGLSLSKLKPLWSTYLTFSDYGRPAIRLSALMELPVIHLFTHDSIGLGEDGPTHQPIEQLASLRAIPHLDVIRPADANEVAEAWRLAIDRTHNPVALILTRQNVPVFDRSTLRLGRGAAARRLRARRLRGRPRADPDRHRQRGPAGARRPRDAEPARASAPVSSASPAGSSSTARTPSTATEVLPPAVTARVAIEEASTQGWERYVGTAGAIIGMTHLRPVGAVRGRRGGVRVHPGQGRRGGA